jgi:hypothetical protein
MLKDVDIFDKYLNDYRLLHNPNSLNDEGDISWEW